MKQFTEPEIEISHFDAEDVIATSGDPIQTYDLRENQLEFK